MTTASINRIVGLGVGLITGTFLNACSTPQTEHGEDSHTKSHAMESVSTQTTSEIEPCVRQLLKLEEGKWAYTGVIARLNGSMGTFIETMITEPAGEDKWSSRAFGGDSESSDPYYFQLIGNKVVPLSGGELNYDAAFTFTSCNGPDDAKYGRLSATSEYDMSIGDGKRLYIKARHWVSEAGTYYHEDLSDEDGNIVSHRTNITTPKEESD